MDGLVSSLLNASVLLAEDPDLLTKSLKLLTVLCDESTDLLQKVIPGLARLPWCRVVLLSQVVEDGGNVDLLRRVLIRIRCCVRMRALRPVHCDCRWRGCRGEVMLKFAEATNMFAGEGRSKPTTWHVTSVMCHDHVKYLL